MVRLIIAILLVLSSFGGALAMSCTSDTENKPPELARSAEEWLQLGLRSFGEQDFDGAILLFKQAIVKDPKLLIAYSYLGASYLETQDNYKAICIFYKILDGDSTYIDAYLGLAEAKWNIGDLSSAFLDLDIAEKMDANDAEVDLLRGDIFLKKNQLDKAILCYRIAVKKDWTNLKTHYKLAEIYFNTSNFESASVHLDEARAFGPFDTDIWLKSALCKELLGNTDSAQFIYDEAAEVAPDSPEIFIMRGNYHYNHGHFDKALKDFDKSIKLNPSNVAAYYNRGCTYSSQGCPEKALFDFNQAIKNDKDEHVDFYTCRAGVLLELGLLNEALEDYSHYIQRSPYDPEIRLKRAKILIKLGRPNDACADLIYAKENDVEEASDLLNQYCAYLLHLLPDTENE